MRRRAKEKPRIRGLTVPTLAELSALPTSRHQRKEMWATSQVGLLAKLLCRSNQCGACQVETMTRRGCPPMDGSVLEQQL
ncbi:hypothetical protein M513_12966 [Trichuris suis]|uniref:Uncharacterized protein n=1 Tax=Trichuris suis TaxID=68888 RepID=A0A085LMG2_9BILA|nr:hypothetical protein M513_12966 [Trichuris suis]